MPIPTALPKTYFSKQEDQLRVSYSMTKIKAPIVISTILLIVYSFSTQLDISYSIIFTLFIAANAVFLWMVYKILKDGKSSEKSFDEYFYEDREDLKRSN